MATCRRPRSDSSIPVKSDERSADRGARPSSSTKSAIDSFVPIAPIRRAMNSWIKGIFDPDASRPLLVDHPNRRGPYDRLGIRQPARDRGAIAQASDGRFSQKDAKLDRRL